MDSLGSVRFSPSAPLYGECPHCGFLEWCSPANLGLPEAKHLNDLVIHQRQIKRGGFLHHAGEPLGSLYVVRTGFVKTILTNDNGNERITGFFMPGEIIGMDAIGTGKHVCDAVAIEDATFCGIRYVDFEVLGRAVPALQHHFHRTMSAEIASDKELMFLLGSMNVTERAAAFLLSMSKRVAARGYSGTRFILPMKRKDIASYLGMTMETISRRFSDFQRQEIIAINGRDVEIRSLARLRQALKPGTPTVYCSARRTSGCPLWAGAVTGKRRLPAKLVPHTAQLRAAAGPGGVKYRKAIVERTGFLT